MSSTLLPQPDPQDVAGSVVRALVLYSLAELQAGHATTIRVKAEGCTFSIADDGRGHAIKRTVGGAPYLQFVYTHLDYPFKQVQDAPIQLQAIGISLINNLCSELTVTARKPDVTLRMFFKYGQPAGDERLEVASQETGNRLCGTVSAHIQRVGVDTQRLKKWLQEVLVVSPGLRLFFNDLEVHNDPPESSQPDLSNSKPH